MSSLLDGHAARHLFVAGCKTNQGRFYPRFDQVVLLTATAVVDATGSLREVVRMLEAPAEHGRPRPRGATGLHNSPCY